MVGVGGSVRERETDRQRDRQTESVTCFFLSPVNQDGYIWARERQTETQRGREKDTKREGERLRERQREGERD